jgi:hypothetical protein
MAGLNVDTDLPVRLRPLIFDPAKQSPQFFADHVVIIIAPGVA